MSLTNEEKQIILLEYKENEKREEPIKVHVIHNEGCGCIGCFIWIIAIMLIPATFGLSLLLPFVIRAR